MLIVFSSNCVVMCNFKGILSSSSHCHHEKKKQFHINGGDFGSDMRPNLELNQNCREVRIKLALP